MKPNYQTIFGSKKLVIFDIDGTLVDTIPIHVNVLTEAYRIHAGITRVDRGIITQNMGAPEKVYIRNVYREHGITTITDEMIQKIEDHHFEGIAGSRSMVNDTFVIPGVVALLEKLSHDGKHLGIISGNPRKTGEGILRHTKLSHFFETIVFGSDLFEGKPVSRRSQMVQRVIEEIQKKDKNVTRENSIVVGDTRHDIESAHDLKMDSLAVGTGGVPEKELRASNPTHFLPSLTECLK